MNLLLDICSWLLLVSGSIFVVIGALGLVRMPDFFTRVHAASVTDTLGAGLILLGLALQAGLTLITVKLLFLALLLFFTSPAATHALTRAALIRGVKPLLAADANELSARIAAEVAAPSDGGASSKL